LKPVSNGFAQKLIKKNGILKIKWGLKII